MIYLGFPYKMKNQNNTEPEENDSKESVVKLQTSGSFNLKENIWVEDGIEHLRVDRVKKFIKLLKEGDNTFIQHIQNHLKEDEKVICKICGKTAEEITNGYSKINKLSGGL